MCCGGGDGGPDLAGIPRAEVSFGAPGIRGRAGAAERELFEGFPHQIWLSADEGTSQDSTHFRGADTSSFCLQIEYE